MNQENTWRHLLDKLSNHHDVVKQQHEGKILYLYTVDLYFARREICDTYYILDLFISILTFQKMLWMKPEITIKDYRDMFKNVNNIKTEK